jgi:hypothetical protein
MTKHIASLGAGLIVTKGSALPSVETPKHMPNKQVSSEKRIALTYKISDSDYKRLKHLGVEQGMSTQSLLDVALGEFLAKQGT